MPASVNGIGTSYSGLRAPIWWTKAQFGLFQSASRPDHDAAEFVVVLFVPIFPLRAFHTFRWQGDDCRAIPIRMTWPLVVRAYLRALLLVVAGIAFFGAGIALLILFVDRSPPVLAWAGGFVLALASAIAALRALDRFDRRTRDIRLVLGPHDLGSSDPALWADEILQKFDSPDLSRATEARGRGDFANAMLLARIAVGRRVTGGEELTDEILGNMRVAGILPALRKAPWRRDELFSEAALLPNAPSAIG